MSTVCLFLIEQPDEDRPLTTGSTQISAATSEIDGEERPERYMERKSANSKPGEDALSYADLVKHTVVLRMSKLERT